MAAENTDKFVKAAKSWVGAVGSGGVADGTVTTIPLVSVTSLPTDTAVTLVIDRVDANGTATPSKMEVTKGVVSGSNIIDCIRGVEGTAQAHSAGAIVEYMLTANMWDSIVDGILVDHNQDGSHQQLTTTGGEVLTLPEATDTLIGKATADILTNKHIPLHAPRGFLLNGKIVVTDASGITVAIKTLAGTDPSATDPVYCRIGDTVQSITSALSRVLADGTNWMNAGSAELATKEIDYFAYLVWDSNSSAVGLSFARIPYANLVSDFSATTTNEKYCAGYSDFTTTDEVENIGRFAATLSAGAGYTWSVPTFTASNLIQRPIFETRWLDWEGTLAWTAGASPNTENANYKTQKYKIISDKVEYTILRVFNVNGTTITKVTSTAPLAPNKQNLTPGTQYTTFGSIYAESGGAYNVGHADSSNGLITISCASATGGQVRIQGFYII